VVRIEPGDILQVGDTQIVLLSSEPRAASVPEPAEVASDTVPHGLPADVQITHAGIRYLLGRAPNYYGIWDRAIPVEPVQRFEPSPEGWEAAWRSFAIAEPRAEPLDRGADARAVAGQPGVPSAGRAPSAGAPTGATLRRSGARGEPARPA